MLGECSELWRFWMRKVNEHNRELSYANYEEQWGYCDIFAPVLWFIVGWVFVNAVFGWIVAVICAVCMWINWRVK